MVSQVEKDVQPQSRKERTQLAPLGKKESLDEKKKVMYYT
jgi:hypothetical protein